ncbi:uncharacterized protein K460DRAFT_357007 [Cucurbitaria berberidis CBS 394.84]|uniref:Uncharacterized protein n=1 Tax=Cucurbitaria berberidis CBS 394.84 TaxID=1168544 RepID=A0A9P4GDJ6_9PLEO|nr:uncharacterized protein K460DRAFT_357007 [Cucurbitaria berberidis CBS 394.84]KAF1843250.1 hypothetical protein K460DRAFT_357007 [Cucurbitaria berberidis CBS 394.84]
MANDVAPRTGRFKNIVKYHPDNINKASNEDGVEKHYENTSQKKKKTTAKAQVIEVADDDAGLVADDDDVAGLLNRKTEYQKDVSMDESIIAERRPKRDKKVIEHLISALPVWRRKGTVYDCDEVHADAWEALKDNNLTMAVDDDDYDPIIIHKYHPILNRHNEATRIFKERAARQLVESTEAFDDRDRREAKEMLGHMLKHARDSYVDGFLADQAADSLADKVFQGNYNPEPTETYTTEEANNCAQRFLDAFDTTQRRTLGEDLLISRVVKSENWIGALAIALLPPREVLERMGKVQTSQGTGENMKKRYREMTTKFLTGYHEEHKAYTSFVYILYSFYTLTRILREKNQTEAAAEAREDDDDDDDGGSDDQDEAYGEGDDDDGGQEARGSGDEKDEPAKKKTVGQTKAKTQGKLGGDRSAQSHKKRKASPADSNRRRKRGRYEEAEN